MSNIDLSEKNIERHCQAFANLLKKPGFSISNDTDVNILFFKRKDKYFGVRAGLKASFQTHDEFLVYSVLIEEISARIKNKLSLKNLELEDCSDELLRNIYKIGNRIDKDLPPISEVEHCYVIANHSDLSWVFLEGESKYYSIFWSDSESKIFSRCA